MRLDQPTLFLVQHRRAGLTDEMVVRLDSRDVLAVFTSADTARAFTASAGMTAVWEPYEFPRAEVLTWLADKFQKGGFLRVTVDPPSRREAKVERVDDLLVESQG